MNSTKGNKLCFKGQTVFVGIDTHKNSNRLTFILNDQMMQTVKRSSDSSEIVDYLNFHFPEANYKSAYEAGFSGFSLHRDLVEAGIDNIVVHAADVPLSDKDKEQKSDKRDSRQIAKCLVAKLLEGIYIPNLDQESLRNMVRYRKQLVNDLSASRIRMKMWLHFMGYKTPPALANSKWNANFINWLAELEPTQNLNKWVLENYLERVEQHRAWLLKTNRQLRELSKSEQYQKDYNLLLSICGIGMVGAWTILSEIGPIERFSSEKKLHSYAGLIPKTYSSGEKHCSNKITNRGNKRLRAQLIESAWVAIRTDPALALFYQKKLKNKDKNIAIVSVAKKLLSRIRAVLINQTVYERNRV